MFGLTAKTKIKLINFYPPYLGAGIKVKKIADDFGFIDVQMKMHWWNKNLFGTHFGGSLSSMTDPFFVFIFMMRLGKGYIIWDKSSKINFRRPGKGTMRCRFELSDAQIEQIKMEVDRSGKVNIPLKVNILNQRDQIVADVEKVIYIRKKGASKRTNHQ